MKRSDLSEEAEKENKEGRSFGGWIEFPSLSPFSLSLLLSFFFFFLLSSTTLSLSLSLLSTPYRGQRMERTKSNPGLCRVILSIRLLNFLAKKEEERKRRRRKRRRRKEDTQNSRRKRNRVGLLCFNLIIWDVLPYPLSLFFFLSLSSSSLFDKFTNNRRERRERRREKSLSQTVRSIVCPPLLNPVIAHLVCLLRVRAASLSFSFPSSSFFPSFFFLLSFSTSFSLIPGDLVVIWLLVQVVSNVGETMVRMCPSLSSFCDK